MGGQRHVYETYHQGKEIVYKRIELTGMAATKTNALLEIANNQGLSHKNLVNVYYD